MEEMGMTNEQWKDNLRIQLDNLEEIEDYIKSDKKEEALYNIPISVDTKRF